MSWEAEANEIRRRRELAKEQGGADGISRQHNYGKLTIRERVDAFLDPGSFREHGRMAGGAYLSEDLQSAETFSPANYVVGVGMVDGRRVAVGGEDFTLKGGSPNAAGLRKSVYSEHLAVDFRVPLVRFLEGGGGSVPTGKIDPREPRTVGNPVYDPHRFAIIAQAMGVVPVVSAAVGPVAGFPAGRLVASHFTVMTKDTSQIMIGGPALVERALGISLTKDELGGAKVHTKSGLVDQVATDEHDAFVRMRQFLSYLPSNVWEHAPRLTCTDPVDRCEEKLVSIVPRNRRHAFDVRKIVEAVVDRGSFFPLGSGFGKSLVIGFARINGQSVGITANDCRFVAGAMTAEAAQKMRRIVELCDTFHLPLVNFIDEPGFMIGPDSEADATIKYGMAAVAAASTAKTPWATVQIHKNFGVASAAHYGPDTYRLTWPSAQSGALPVEGGVAVAYRRQLAAAEDPDALRAELEEQLMQSRKPYPAAESFSVHDLIDPRETRPVLCEWVDWIQPKLATLSGPTGFAMRP
ncbi:MAG: propionyl-CoA carboxylase [Chromatiales bacterium]|jgi:acetyl-CoA carboxylase carboxyltransferase component|nr:propionyl-CoA carboxylase [Chromatiales bacterium]